MTTGTSIVFGAIIANIPHNFMSPKGSGRHDESLEQHEDVGIDQGDHNNHNGL